MYKGCYEYLHKVIPNANYSPIYFQTSKIVSGVNQAFMDYSTQGAAGILIHSIQWDSANDLGSLTATFKEKSTMRIMLKQRNQGSYNNTQYFSFYIDGPSELNVICDNPDVYFI